MAIDQTIDYKANPPRGLEKILYRLTSWLFIIAVVSFFLSLPLILLSHGGEDGSTSVLFPFLDQYGVVYPIGLLAISLVGIALVIIMASASSEVDSRVIATEFTISVVLMILSGVWLMIRGVNALFDWLTQMLPRESFADNLTPYIYGYLVCIGTLIVIISGIWFCVVRIRERKAGVNMLQGSFLRKTWQFFVGDAFSIKETRSNGEICFEAKLYGYWLFFRWWFFMAIPLFLFVFVDLGVRWLLSLL